MLASNSAGAGFARESDEHRFLSDYLNGASYIKDDATNSTRFRGESFVILGTAGGERDSLDGLRALAQLHPRTCIGKGNPRAYVLPSRTIHVMTCGSSDPRMLWLDFGF